MSKIIETTTFLDQEFNIKDLDHLKYFLGIEVVRASKDIVPHQRKYTLDILEDCGQLGCRPSLFPMEQNLKLDKSEESHHIDAS